MIAMFRCAWILAGISVAASAASAQDYSKGTGQEGCYFGRNEQGQDCTSPPTNPDPGTVPPNRPPPPAILPMSPITDKCLLGNEVVLLNAQNQIFSQTYPSQVPVGVRRFPPASPFCVFDLVSLTNNSQYCVLQANGWLYLGGPPQIGGQYVGYCLSCRQGGC
jgi:hypothetical protein